MCQSSATANKPSPKFLFGRVVITPDALAEIPSNEILAALSRHGRGDWGTLAQLDWNANEEALKHGDRLFSLYYSTGNIKFYIITEWDRSETTVLLPEEYTE